MPCFPYKKCSNKHVHFLVYTICFKKKHNKKFLKRKRDFLGENGFEPLTKSFSSFYSTTELFAFGSDRNRTDTKHMQNVCSTIKLHPFFVFKYVR
jgi:hypothetical protein